MYADIAIRPRNLGGIYDHFIDLVGDGSIQSINQHISASRGFETKKIRIQGKTEVLARKVARKTGSYIEIIAIKTAKCLSEAVLLLALSIDDAIGKRYEIATGKQFDEKYSERDIFNLVRLVPSELRKNPTYPGLAGLFPQLSKRQIGKLRARIKKEMDFTGSVQIIPD